MHHASGLRLYHSRARGGRFGSPGFPGGDSFDRNWNVEAGFIVSLSSHSALLHGKSHESCCFHDVFAWRAWHGLDISECVVARKSHESCCFLMHQRISEVHRSDFVSRSFLA